ncbi:hypothetical protein ACKWTF_015897 [Chironomus riparius]
MSIKLPDSRFVILFLTFLTLNLEKTIQQTTIDDINAIQATCDYIYDSEHTYTCNLLNAVIVNDFDVLEITGTHLDDRTDEDILKLNYHNTSNLDEHERMVSCYGNLIETTTSQSTEGAEETTSGGSGNNFKYFEVFLTIFVGLVLNFMRI